MNKKGISPLIATVLIIGFTIVLAVLVITWISGTVTDQTESTDCMVEVESACLNSVGDISLEGVDAGAVTFTVANEGGENFDTTATSDGLIIIADSTGVTIETIALEVGPYATQVVSPAVALVSGNAVRVISIIDNGECTADCDPVEEVAA